MPNKTIQADGFGTAEIGRFDFEMTGCDMQSSTWAIMIP